MTYIFADEWKSLRTTFSPIFTSGKMKNMLNLMQVTCDKLVEEFGTLAKEKECFDVKEVIGNVMLMH